MEVVGLTWVMFCPVLEVDMRFCALLMLLYPFASKSRYPTKVYERV